MLAALAPDQHEHAACLGVLRNEEGPFALSPFVLAELDYLVTKFRGAATALRLWDEVARGAYRLEPFTRHDVERAREIATGYPDLEIGLADASLVVLSERLGTPRILTLDERHFRALRGANGQRFVLLPSDA